LYTSTSLFKEEVWIVIVLSPLFSKEGVWIVAFVPPSIVKEGGAGGS